MNSQNDMDVTEGPSKTPSKSEIRSAINTLSLHSVFVDQDWAEKMRRHTRKLSNILEKNCSGIFLRPTVCTSQNHLRMS